MTRSFRMLLLLGALLFTPGTALYAQHHDAADRPPEVDFVQAAVQRLIESLQRVTAQFDAEPAVGLRLNEFSVRLHDFPVPPPAPRPPLDPDLQRDLADLEDLLRELYDDVDDLRDSLDDAAQQTLSDRLAPIERGLDEAIEQVARLRDEAERRPEPVEAPDTTGARHDDEDVWVWEDLGKDDEDADERWDEEAAEAWDADDDGEDGDDEDSWGAWRDRWKREGDHRWHRDADTFVGDLPYDWPYKETALYRYIPAVRYNRVEGFVLGIGLRPLEWEEYDRAKIVGQAGYAFALDRWRYDAGAEVRLNPGASDDYGLKLGGNYHYNTATNDLWKSNWLENSLGAFFFESDFFDYYQVQGWTLYGVQRLTPWHQVSVGFRSDDYGSLARNTHWSLFGGNEFALNPDIREGRMNALALAVEGGRVRDLSDLPRGFAYRAEYEYGKGLGGDFSFTRLVADGRAYLPVSDWSSFNVRLRGGLATDDAPFQKAFTLGGIGSVRGYPQNVFAGTRMLLGNAEFVMSDLRLLDDLLEDMLFFGFFDAGWVNNAGSDRFRTDDVLPSAGFGIGLNDRNLRLELAFPLKDAGYGLEPSLWLRLSPSF